MRILVTGSHGLVGRPLVELLYKKGHTPLRLVRDPSQMSEDTLLWNPERHELDKDSFEGLDAVINLAGDNIASGRWTEEKKRKIKDSRVLRTHILAELLASLKAPPKTFLGASATGFYGHESSDTLTERDPAGKGFLADVCRGWEEASAPLKKAGSRVVNMRLGMVLAKEGGALAKMLLPFQLGFGGVIGSGKQPISWISLNDLLRAITFLLDHEMIFGPVNMTSPYPVTNTEFTKTLGKTLHRPTLFPMPAFAAKLIFGEMADELLLNGVRIVPEKLLAHGFSFEDAHLNEALHNILGAG